MLVCVCVRTRSDVQLLVAIEWQELNSESGGEGFDDNEQANSYRRSTEYLRDQQEAEELAGRVAFLYMPGKKESIGDESEVGSIPHRNFKTYDVFEDAAVLESNYPTVLPASSGGVCL